LVFKWNSRCSNVCDKPPNGIAAKNGFETRFVSGTLLIPIIVSNGASSLVIPAGNKLSLQENKLFFAKSIRGWQ
jgi:hypothetical protein